MQWIQVQIVWGDWHSRGRKFSAPTIHNTLYYSKVRPLRGDGNSYLVGAKFSSIWSIFHLDSSIWNVLPSIWNLSQNFSFELITLKFFDHIWKSRPILFIWTHHFEIYWQHLKIPLHTFHLSSSLWNLLASFWNPASYFSFGPTHLKLLPFHLKLMPPIFIWALTFEVFGY